MGNTTNGYPYPEATDLVSNGDNVLANLATAADTKGGITATGFASTGTPTLNTPLSVTVTFPAGRFTVAPAVVVGNQESRPQQTAVATAAPTATGVTLWATRTSGALDPIGMWWIAAYVP